LDGAGRQFLEVDFRFIAKTKRTQLSTRSLSARR
jgi:hypothetical protein